MTILTTKLIIGSDLQSYLKEHTTDYGISQFKTVVKPLHVFKQVRSGTNYARAIANLIIPEGAVIYVPYRGLISNKRDNRKMRANKAFVHSITRYGTYTSMDASGTVAVDLDQCQPKKNAYSIYTNDFRYRVGRTVRPDRFEFHRETCAGGIHFFLNLADALTYS